MSGANFDLYRRITDDRAFGEVLKNMLFDQYVRAHRQAEELIKRGESKTLEVKSTLRWNLNEGRQDDKAVTHAVLKTIAAFLNTEGGGPEPVFLKWKGTESSTGGDFFETRFPSP